MGDILFLAHRVPYPPDRGDKIRGFHVLKRLAKTKRVHLAAFADDSRDLTRKSALANLTGSRAILWRSKSRLVAGIQSLLTRRPVSVTAFDDAAMRQVVRNVLARHAIDTIYVFSSQMAQYLPDGHRARVVMDFVDMDSAKFAAYGKASGGLKGWLMRREGRLLLAHDRGVANDVDASVFVSDDEAQAFRERTGADNVHVVGNGIDFDTFDPSAPFKRVDATGELIVFTGQMDYRPNIEAVTWFVDTVFPHIRVRYPNARFAIVGRAPSDAVKALAATPGVIVTGEVSDVRGWIAAAAVVVAPLRQAHGIQNKVLEAMAMARPVVVSGAAAQGIDHGGTIRVGDTVAELADHITDLLADPAAATVLGAAARNHVVASYGWDARLAPLDALAGLRASPADRRSAA